MYKIGEEEMVICPYNGHHVVSKLRIQKHMIKCQKNNPNVKLATCFYNYSHRLKPEDLLAHYEICSHKTRVDGARYSEPISRPSSAAAKSDLPRRNFPDIFAKTQIFRDPSFFFSSLDRKFDEDSQKFETSGSESENEDFHLKANEKIAFKTSFSSKDKDDDEDNEGYEDDICDNDEDNEGYEDDICDNDEEKDDEDDDDDLKPLPLPKTVSKAFVYSKQQASKSSTLMSSESKPFGRGKSLLAFSPPKEPRTTDHLLPDLSGIESNLPKTEKSSKFFLRNPSSSCSISVVSSMFDDTTTLKSEEVIFDNELNENDDGFILKNFDKYQNCKKNLRQKPQIF